MENTIFKTVEVTMEPEGIPQAEIDPDDPVARTYPEPSADGPYLDEIRAAEAEALNKAREEEAAAELEKAELEAEADPDEDFGPEEDEPAPKEEKPVIIIGGDDEDDN